MGRKRITRRKGKLGIDWYSGTHYRVRQPYATYVGSAIESNQAKIMLEKIKSLVGHPETCSALEIGPGEAPILPLLPFRRMTFLEQSTGIAKKLSITLKKYNPHIIVGDARRLPTNTRFNLVVMNEVLTHIEPNERLATIAAIAEKTDTLFLIDRPQIELKKVGERMERMRQIHNATRMLDEPEWAPAKKIAIQQRHATLVKFKPIAGYLRAHGWNVIMEHHPSETSFISGQMILTAWRQK